DALVQSGVGQDLLRLVSTLGGILGVLYRQRGRITRFLLYLGDVARDVDVTLLDSKISVAAEDVFDAILRKPVDLRKQPVVAEPRYLGGGGRTPITKGT